MSVNTKYSEKEAILLSLTYITGSTVSSASKRWKQSLLLLVSPADPHLTKRSRDMQIYK